MTKTGDDILLYSIDGVQFDTIKYSDEALADLVKGNKDFAILRVNRVGHAGKNYKFLNAVGDYQPQIAKVEGRNFAAAAGNAGVGGEYLTSQSQLGATDGSGISFTRDQTELDDLAKDPSHGGKIDTKSIAEREVGIGLESQGKVGKLIRDPSGSADYVDSATGQKWDVKAFNSKFAPKGYNLSEAMNKIQKSIGEGENVMLDTRNLHADHLAELIGEIAKQGLMDKVLLWP